MDTAMMLSVLSQMRQFRKRDQWTRQQVETYQKDALRSLRTYVYIRSPFYQQFHKGLYEAPLHELPVLTKSMMMAHFNDLVTARAGRQLDDRGQALQPVASMTRTARIITHSRDLVASH